MPFAAFAAAKKDPLRYQRPTVTHGRAPAATDMVCKLEAVRGVISTPQETTLHKPRQTINA
jgi:hypothetical protein